MRTTPWVPISCCVCRVVIADVWRELGRELFRTHSIEPDDSNSALPPPGSLADPRAPVQCGRKILTSRRASRHLQLGLIPLPRGPQPGLSWGERPLSKLLDTLAFFLGNPPEPWRGLGPERRA